MQVGFRILGPLEVRVSGKQMRIRGVRQQKLLALLLLNANRVVTVERLVDEIWETPPRSVRQQVHNAIGGLRGKLPAHLEDVGITTTDAGYRLDVPDDAVDAAMFRRLVAEAEHHEADDRNADALRSLRTALALWRGEALVGLDGKMILNSATDLNEQRVAALERLMSLRLAEGESDSLVGELRTLVADHPMRETLRGHLMVALHQSGRQAEALAVYDQGRRLLAGELGIDPGPKLRRLHSAILRQEDVDPMRRAMAVAPTNRPPLPVAHAPARSYLPHDIGDFSGRTAEVERLLSTAREARPAALVITAIDGMGGVGKTTLAVHLGHQVVRDYPDGQFFIDLHGFSPGVSPVPPEQALDALLRDSGVQPELVPYGIEGRSALWRSGMAGKRALLILDNAVDAAHVRPLLPGTAGVLVVVTSRRKLSALDGAVPLSLDVLPPEEAVEMFTRVVGEERVRGQEHAVAAVVERCGRLPLAIRIAAARLRDRSSWAVDDLLTRLADQSRRLRFLQAGDLSVDTAIKVSYRYLPPVRQRLFRLLSLYPGTDFDAHLAAALADLPVDETEQHLEALFDDNLLKQNVAGRFHLHDLVRDCAGQLLAEVADEDGRRAAVRRVLDYCIQAAYTWSRDLDNRIHNQQPRTAGPPARVRPAETARQGIALLDAEHHNFIDVVRYAAEHGWDDHAWQLACYLQPSLRDRGYGGCSREVFDLGLAASRRSGDTRGESACLQGLAAVCREAGSFDDGRAHLEQALALQDEHDPESRAALLIEVGNLYLAEERLEEAERAFRTAKGLVAHAPDNMLSAVINNNLGVIYRDLGHSAKALVHLERTLSAKSSERFPQANLFTLWSIGAVHHMAGDQYRASSVFRQVLDRSRDLRFDHGEAVALLGLSTVSRVSGDFERAVALGRQALALARRLGLPLLECEVLNAIGEAVTSSGDTDQAEKVGEQALEYARRHGAKRYEGRALEGLAHIAWSRGELATANRLWRNALDCYPSGFADAAHVHHHLRSLDEPGTTCFRCHVKRSQESATA
jgi:DNA-binding SARP family transcriptional activator/tetratricopeptide (TPR) repeat protein